MSALGEPVDPSPAANPERIALEGRVVRLEPLNPERHGDSLWENTHGVEQETLWRYLFEGPFPSRGDFDEHLKNKAKSADPLFYAIVDQTSDRALGWATLMRIEPGHRVIEVGNIVMGRALQRTTGATEAMYLLAGYIFEELGYRRYEWKCHWLNEPSRRAAERLGFTFEGIFRQHLIVKGRNRDTAWYSMLDHEWPQRKAAFESWLEPANFDEAGQQKTALASLRR